MESGTRYRKECNRWPTLTVENMKEWFIQMKTKICTLTNQFGDLLMMCLCYPSSRYAPLTSRNNKEVLVDFSSQVLESVCICFYYEAFNWQWWCWLSDLWAASNAPVILTSIVGLIQQYGDNFLPIITFLSYSPSLLEMHQTGLDWLAVARCWFRSAINSNTLYFIQWT